MNVFGFFSKEVFGFFSKEPNMILEFCILPLEGIFKFLQRDMSKVVNDHGFPLHSFLPF